MSRFSGTPLDWLDSYFVTFSPQQTFGITLNPVVVAVEKWKAFCAFQAQGLFHGHQAAACCRGRWSLPLDTTAQAIRASLLAMATITLLRGALELEQPYDHSEFQRRVPGFREELRQISDDVQALLHDLHGWQLEYLGAVAGMKSWCKELAKRQKMDIEFRSDVRSVLALDVGRSLFRVLQEALHNVFKHSGVKRIDVQLHEEAGEIHLIVRDLGKGFDIEAAQKGRGLGLTGMRERVRLLNGTITIESKPMVGTTIHVRVPLESNRAQKAEL